MGSETPSTPSKLLTKRNGSKEALSKDKMKARLSKLLFGLSTEHLNLDLAINKVFEYSPSGKNKFILAENIGISYTFYRLIYC